jgi:hypothetical protein
MFISCIIRRSRNDQLYALICTTPVFYILAPTCLSTSLSPSGSFLDHSKLLKVHIGWVVYHIMCGYVIYISSNSEGSKELPDDDRLLLKHVRASI